MTKAERIYIATRVECKNSVIRHGQMFNPDGSVVGFNSVSYDDRDFICVRTLNEMEKLLAKDRATLRASRKYNIIPEEKLILKEQTYNMIEATIRNTREMLAKFFA